MNKPVLAPPRTPPQPRFLRIARLARGLVLFGGALFVVNELCMTLMPDWAANIIKIQTDVTLLGPLTPATRAMVLLWDLPALFVVLAALYELWKLFGEYLQSRVFSARALASLRDFARWILADALLSPVYRAVLSVIATWQNGPGHRQFNLNLSSDDYFMLLVGVVMLAISTVMVEAARIAEDNEGFV